MKNLISLFWLMPALVNATIITPTVGTSVSSDPSQYGAVVRNNLTISSGTISGEYLVGGIYSEPYPMANTVTVTTGQIADWNLLEMQSNYLSNMPTTGIVNQTGTSMFFVSDQSGNGADVFQISAKDLTRVNNFHFNSKAATPGAAPIVINVLGENVVISGSGFQFSQVDPGQLVLNFVNAKTVTLNGINATATIIAPNAAVTLMNGQVHGTVVADSLKITGATLEDRTFQYVMPGWQEISGGGGQFNTPEPSTWAMLAMGAALVAFGTWHRKSSDTM